MVHQDVFNILLLDSIREVFIEESHKSQPEVIYP